MPHIDRKTSKPAIAVLMLLLAALALAACGGSSKSSSTSTQARASTTTSGAAGAPGSRFSALRECLQKNGITLPKRTPGQARPGGALGILPGGGRTLPSGVTRAQYEAALKKCGGSSPAGSANRFNSPAAKQALAKFAACMRASGVNLPTPNTSGKGPVFSTGTLNTSSAQFKAAEAKCSSALRGALPGRPGGGAPAGGAGTAG